MPSSRSPDLPAAFLSRPIAHRGLHDPLRGIPENSLAAFRAAMEAGFGIECDIQPAGDGIPMVFHDESLGRLTGAMQQISGLSRVELAMLRLLGTSEHIPSLSESLDVVAGRVPILIEIKAQPDKALSRRLSEKSVEALGGYNGPIALMSFEPGILADIAACAPDIPRGLTSKGPEAPEPAQWGASFVSQRASDLAMPEIAALKARGMPILCWTIRSAAEEAEARRTADNVTFEGYLPA